MSGSCDFPPLLNHLRSTCNPNFSICDGLVELVMSFDATLCLGFEVSGSIPAVVYNFLWGTQCKLITLRKFVFLRVEIQQEANSRGRGELDITLPIVPHN